METLRLLLDYLVHPDVHLAELLQQHGDWIYAVLFAVLFCETGLVVTPFLPGDSLLFVAGALWASTGADTAVLMATLIVAVLCGDNVNFWVGHFLGPKVFGWERSRFFNRRALEQTQAYYARHGGKTVVMARFVPLVRTFAPFVAGVGQMTYRRFLAFSVAGAVLWVTTLVGAGHFFGNVPIVRDNLTLAILAIVALSLVPVVLQIVRARGVSQAAADHQD